MMAARHGGGNRGARVAGPLMVATVWLAGPGEHII
jgi:hypothetical protein